MQPLTPNRLLAAWEAGLTLSPNGRALAMLAVACPDASLEDLSRLNIGERDRRLASLRNLTFGPRLDCRAQCPRCDDLLEWQLSGENLVTGSASGPVTVQCDTHVATFRIPATDDLEAVAETSTPQVGRSLLQRCFLAARSTGNCTADNDAGSETLSFQSLPETVLEKAEACMAEACPASAAELDLSCPACGHRWTSRLDLAAFLWAEVDAAAGILLSEIHQIASAYGWSEESILALSESRRAAYLDLIGQ